MEDLGTRDIEFSLCLIMLFLFHIKTEKQNN